MSYNELILIQIRMIFIHIHRIIFFYKNFFSQVLLRINFKNSANSNNFSQIIEFHSKKYLITNALNKAFFRFHLPFSSFFRVFIKQLEYSMNFYPF